MKLKEHITSAVKQVLFWRVVIVLLFTLDAQKKIKCHFSYFRTEFWVTAWGIESLSFFLSQYLYMIFLPLSANQRDYPFPHSQTLTMGFTSSWYVVWKVVMEIHCSHYMRISSPECSGTKVQEAECVFPGFSKRENTHPGGKSYEVSKVNAFQIFSSCSYDL